MQVSVMSSSLYPQLQAVAVRRGEGHRQAVPRRQHPALEVTTRYYYLDLDICIYIYLDICM